MFHYTRLLITLFLIVQVKSNIISSNGLKAGCTVPISSLKEPQPTFVVNNQLIIPSGNSGNYQFSDGQTVQASCPGTNNGLVHPSTSQRPASATLTCRDGALFSSADWLPGTAIFGEITCSTHSSWLEGKVGTCANGLGVSIAVGVHGLNGATSLRYDTLSACFKENTAEALYVLYKQTPENKVYQPNVVRPDFKQGAWYPGMNVNTLYTQNSQKQAIASVVGSALADKYVTTYYYMARGHLAAKVDFVMSTEQRATFTFINVVPQWQPFNAGNWQTLEEKLRIRISDANYRTDVYTGSWGILQLKDSNGTPRDIYLSVGDKKLPAPLWLFKVAHDKSTNRATAFLGLNNPHVTLEEAKRLSFCADKCNGNSQFNWLSWKAENVTLGFSICCDVDDFRRTVPYLPQFTVSGLLY